MDMQRQLPRLQALSESLMVDECVVETAGESVVDPESLQDVTFWDQVYAGKCRVQRVNVQASEVEAAAAYAGKTSVDVRLPITAPEVPRGARVTIPRHSRLTGRAMVVKGRSFQTFEKDARYACEGVDW